VSPFDGCSPSLGRHLTPGLGVLPLPSRSHYMAIRSPGRVADSLSATQRRASRPGCTHRGFNPANYLASRTCHGSASLSHPLVSSWWLRNYEAMTDTWQGPGWWIASDGKWYPPHLHPSYRPPLMRMILHRWKLKRAFKRASRQPVSQVQWSDVPAPSDYWAHRAPGPWTAGDEQAHVITPERWGGAHNR
jgi:hypothetical protein